MHERLAHALEGPMLVLSVGFLVVLGWPIVHPDVGPSTRSALTAADWGIWAAFAVEYLALLITAPDRRRFARTHVLDLVVVVLPLLRPLRLVRSIRLLRLFRVTRLAAVMARSAQRSRTAFFSRAVLFALSLGGVVVLAAAVVVLDLERGHPQANINSFGDALWWAITTSTTVGYGDRYPVTAAGRTVAAVLMFVGLAIVGVVTAAIAAWLVSLTQGPVAEIAERQDVDLGRLHEQLVILQAAVDDLRARNTQSDSGGAPGAVGSHSAASLPTPTLGSGPMPMPMESGLTD